MRVAQISCFMDPVGRPPRELLRAWPSLGDIAAIAGSSGAEVTVIQACASDEQFTDAGIEYFFLRPERPGASLADAAAFARVLAERQIDVLHVHGLDAPRDLLALRSAARRLPMLVQDHANRPPRIWRRRASRHGFAVADGVAFCSAEQAEPFLRARLLQPHTRIYEVPESSSRFRMQSVTQARQACGLYGNPCVLWVGHLDHNKDPLTVLEGTSRAMAALPDLQLWCCYGEATLLPVVQERLRGDERLGKRVHLLGRLPHTEVEVRMQAADLFVLGSHREGSGYSLIEALATGLWPVVTDIPSFRVLTGNGSVGDLWPCGDAARLCDALLSAAARPRADTRRAVRAHFEAQLSFEAVGQRWKSVYLDLIARGAHAG